MAKNREEGSAEWDVIEIGDQVRHPKWGVGTVLFRSGMGNNAKAIVVFPEEGQKKLMLRYAKLQKVGTTSLKSVEKMKAETAPPKPPVSVHEEAEEEEEAVDLELNEGAEDEDLVLDDEDSDVVGFDDDDEGGFGHGHEGEEEL